MKYLFAPLAALYGLAVAFWQYLYKVKILKRASFSLPVICVGNLSVGGTGKTPHTEYLVNYLKEYIKVATLSRGYGRKSTGFHLVEPHHSSHESGDEPVQIKRKFPDIMVAVGENRMMAIPSMMQRQPDLQTIILDDAFQHLAVKAGYNILLTAFDDLYINDHLLPVGKLREFKSGAHRADIIIVTKCPEQLSEAEAERITASLKPLPGQAVFFTTFSYGYPYYIFNPSYQILADNTVDGILVTGIAEPKPLFEYLSKQCKRMRLVQYPDHHEFDKGEIGGVFSLYENTDSPRKAIFTTEKDAVRLWHHREFLLQKQIPIFAVPAQVKFLFNGEQGFQQLLKNYLLDFKV